MPEYERGTIKGEVEHMTRTFAADEPVEAPTLAERSQHHQDAIARLGDRVSAIEMQLDNVTQLLQKLVREVGL